MVIVRAYTILRVNSIPAFARENPIHKPNASSYARNDRAGRPISRFSRFIRYCRSISDECAHGNLPPTGPTLRDIRATIAQDVVSLDFLVLYTVVESAARFCARGAHGYPPIHRASASTHRETHRAGGSISRISRYIHYPRPCPAIFLLWYHDAQGQRLNACAQQPRRERDLRKIAINDPSFDDFERHT